MKLSLLVFFSALFTSISVLAQETKLEDFVGNYRRLEGSTEIGESIEVKYTGNGCESSLELLDGQKLRVTWKQTDGIKVNAAAIYERLL